MSDLARLTGLTRSLWLYYGVPGRLRATRRFYAQLIRPGDLCFDVGAHAGNRAWVWAGLGARAVALEPQPDFARWLRWLARRRCGIEVVEQALGPSAGTLTLNISRRHPTVTTGSSGFLKSVATAPAFRQVRWDRRVDVPMTTLDALVHQYGRPAFIKIDVEGFEAEVLAGLSTPVPSLSFEWLAETMPVALACVERLERLGPYRFNVSKGESMRFSLRDWVEADEIRRWLRVQQSGSGDVYARLPEETRPEASTGSAGSGARRGA